MLNKPDLKTDMSSAYSAPVIKPAGMDALL